jgi:transaldolase
MTDTLLTQLRTMTTVVADSGDISSVLRFKPQDSTTNPSLLAAAAKMPEYASLVDGVLREAKEQCSSDASDADVAKMAFRHLAVAFGELILHNSPGRVSTEVDARLSFDRAATLAQSRDVIGQYEAAGISRQRVLIKIAATWEGIQAAKELEQEGIHCNLTLVFGMHQAVACADAKVTLISPFVGRILDWYKQRTGSDYVGPEDPGVQSVTAIYNYMKKFNHTTLVMGASFRNVSEVRLLAGCDLLTISPKLLTELDETTGTLQRMLSPARAAATVIKRIKIDEGTFERLHRLDSMATDQLAQGIAGFRASLEQLEQLLTDRLSALALTASTKATAA